MLSNVTPLLDRKMRGGTEIWKKKQEAKKEVQRWKNEVQTDYVGTETEPGFKEDK